MQIEKEGRIYTVSELETTWRVTTAVGKVKVSYQIPKDECKNAEDVARYIAGSELF